MSVGQAVSVTGSKTVNVSRVINYFLVSPRKLLPYSTNTCGFHGICNDCLQAS